MAGAALIAGAKQAAQMIASNPDVLRKVGDYYQKATGKQLPANVAGLTAIASRGAAPASVLLKGAVRAGLNPNDIFEKVSLQGQADAASARVIEELQSTFERYRGAMDADASVRAGGNLADSLYKKEIILFARKQFGSASAIREAHAKMRAFLHMDTAALEEQIALHIS